MQHATARDTDDIQTQRYAYQEKMGQLDPQDLVFVAETGVNMAMTRPYGRAPQGQRVHTSAPVNKGTNVTVLGALLCDGMLAAMTLEGITDAQVF